MHRVFDERTHRSALLVNLCHWLWLLRCNEALQSSCVLHSLSCLRLPQLVTLLSSLKEGSCDSIFVNHIIIDIVISGLLVVGLGKYRVPWVLLEENIRASFVAQVFFLHEYLIHLLNIALALLMLLHFHVNNLIWHFNSTLLFVMRPSTSWWLISKALYDQRVVILISRRRISYESWIILCHWCFWESDVLLFNQLIATWLREGLIKKIRSFFWCYLVLVIFISQISLVTG